MTCSSCLPRLPYRTLCCSQEREDTTPRCTTTESEYSGGFVTEVFLLHTPVILSAGPRLEGRLSEARRNRKTIKVVVEYSSVQTMKTSHAFSDLRGIGGYDYMIGWMLPRRA